MTSLPPSHPIPITNQRYSALLNKTCGAAAQAVPTLPVTDVNNFMSAYQLYNGTQNETDVIRLGNVLLSRQDVVAFLSGNGGAAIDAQLVLCAVLFEATPANLAAFAEQGKVEEALLDSLLGDTVRHAIPPAF